MQKAAGDIRSMPKADSTDAGNQLKYLRQEVGPNAAYTLCTFGILSRDRARLASVLLPSDEGVTGPKLECRLRVRPRRHLTGNSSAIEARSCHAGVPVGRIAL